MNSATRLSTVEDELKKTNIAVGDVKKEVTALRQTVETLQKNQKDQNAQMIALLTKIANK